MTDLIRSKGNHPSRRRVSIEDLLEQAEYARRRRAHEALQAEMHPELAPSEHGRTTTHFSFRDVNKGGSKGRTIESKKTKLNPRHQSRRHSDR